MGKTFLILLRIKSLVKSKTLMAASSSAEEAALLMENSSEQVLSMPGRKANVAKISKKKTGKFIMKLIILSL